MPGMLALTPGNECSYNGERDPDTVYISPLRHHGSQKKKTILGSVPVLLQQPVNMGSQISAGDLL